MSKDCSVCLDKGELPTVDRPCPLHNSRGREISQKYIFIFPRAKSLGKKDGLTRSVPFPSVQLDGRVWTSILVRGAPGDLTVL